MFSLESLLVDNLDGVHVAIVLGLGEAHLAERSPETLQVNQQRSTHVMQARTCMDEKTKLTL